MLFRSIGRALGCGGHLAALRRTASGHFSLSEAVPLDRVAELAEADRIKERMIPMAEALAGMAVHAADKPLTHKLMYGNTITVRDLPPPKTDGGYVKVLDRDGNLLAVLHHEKGRERYQYAGNFALTPA